MSHSLTETETKLYVPDLGVVAARLAAQGGVLEAPRVFERNVRYEDAGATLTPRGIVLRLRQDTRVRLTYKGAPEPGGADGVLERFEAEVTVDDFDRMDRILRQLGYHPAVVYEKYRTTYTLHGAEVVLDELPYGTFVEIEGPRAAIARALAALELVDAPRMGTSYLGLFERVKAALGLTMHDLTFADFAGVAVPPGVFTGEG